MLTHGQDITLKPNSVLMEMLTTHKTLVNAMVPSGSVEETTRREIESELGKNSECGKLHQRLTKLYTLDVTNILSESWNLTKDKKCHAGVNQNQTISQQFVLKKLVTTAFVTVE